MPGPRPHLWLTCGRTILVVVHLAGIGLLFLPMAYGGWQPIGFVRRVADPDAWLTGGRLPPIACLPGLALLVIPAAVWLTQVRAFLPQRLARLEVWWGWAMGIFAGGTYLWFIPVETWGTFTGPMVDAPWVTAFWTTILWTPAVVLIVLLIAARRRRLARSLSGAVLERGMYLGVATWGLALALNYGGSWRAGFAVGVYVAFAVVAWYAGEIVFFLWLGQRDAEGRVTHPLLALWLPSGEIAGPDDAPLCPACGYDLRGTLAAGRSECPECGHAIAAPAAPQISNQKS